MTATLSQSGYSGTPLRKKLGLKDGQRVLFLSLPSELDELVDAAAFASIHRAETDQPSPGDGFNLIHAFFTEAAALRRSLPALMAAIVPDGMIWISWPKKSSGETTDITENTIRDVALPLGLVDVKVCAVNQTWSGLKLVIRLSERTQRG